MSELKKETRYLIEAATRHNGSFAATTEITKDCGFSLKEWWEYTVENKRKQEQRIKMVIKRSQA